MTEIKTRTVFLTKNDLEVMDECLSLQLRILRNQVVTTWKDKEYYDKVKELRDHVEMMLNSFEEPFGELEASKEEEE